MSKAFTAAAEQVTRYGRQLSFIDWNLRMQANERGDIDAETLQNSGYMGVWKAYQTFIAQFNSSVSEVLTRTFWQAYYS